MWKALLPAFRFTVLLTITTGLIYPFVVTGLCQLLFHDKADGSLVGRNGHTVGSLLIGQNFATPKYFHPRPSAAGNDGYDATASSGSNFGPTSQKLYDRVKASADQFRKENPSFTGLIPADAVTASGSGLDPEISVANAEAQLTRVAEARKTSPDAIQSLLSKVKEGRDLGLLGEDRVNVLKVNLLLDKEAPVK